MTFACLSINTVSFSSVVTNNLAIIVLELVLCATARTIVRANVVDNQHLQIQEFKIRQTIQKTLEVDCICSSIFVHYGLGQRISFIPKAPLFSLSAFQLLYYTQNLCAGFSFPPRKSWCFYLVFHIDKYTMFSGCSKN